MKLPELDTVSPKVKREQKDLLLTEADLKDIIISAFWRAGVAQSVVQLIRNQQVACSSHVTSSNNKGQSKDWPLLLETLGIS